MHTGLAFTCDPPGARLRFSGEFDLSTNEQVDELFDLVAARGCDRLELDLADVSFIDAGTLYLLDAHRRRITSGGGSFVVVAESSCYRRVCELTHFVVLTADGQPDPETRADASVERPHRRPHTEGRRPQGRPSSHPHRG